MLGRSLRRRVHRERLHRHRRRIHQDLNGKLADEWMFFNREFIAIFLEANPDKTKVAAGLACLASWTVSKGIQKGHTFVGHT